ncbi:MAG: response regulator [Ruminiclostridium sp.]|nr:response regulator [Ruminiclostridium sp.]
MSKDDKNVILIVDDIEINRVILAETFRENYDILEAENGEEALKIIDSDERVVAVLLDLLMPVMSGIDVLREMNKSGKINNIPVFIVTAANDDPMLMDAYNLGATDIISKPIMPDFIKCRINNVIELYRHRYDLESLLEEKVDKLNLINQSMIETLANIIEFRDGESGEHVKRISSLSKKLLIKLCKMYPEYYLPKAEIDKISSASILHDVGKIAIPDSILNKPGRLTKEEFEIMKSHSVKGCEILSHIPNLLDEDTYKYSYDICRHHHERWDGKGYPDGLAGDEISIWAQAVSIVDVYDALISPRVYKAPFPHDVAVKMIYNGECGTFNPKILEAFNEAIGKESES